MIEFRPLTEADLPLLFDWLHRPHIQAWWKSPSSLDAVREEYFRRKRLGRLGRISCIWTVKPSVICSTTSWRRVARTGGPTKRVLGVLGIDQFLADAARLGQGLGTAMVKQFTTFLFQDPTVTQIRVDPRPDNAPAIRCYTKAGFRKVGPITTPDGPALFMVLDRAGR